MIPVERKANILSSVSKTEWDHFFQKLPVQLRDINFTYDYHHVYKKNGDGEMLLFIFSDSDNIFYYPFFKKEIFLNGRFTGYYDVETVYGYSGPVSGSADRSFIATADEALREYFLEEKVICEFIRFHPLVNNHETGKMMQNISVIPLRDYVTVDTSLTQDQILSGYTSQNRNKIRKAEAAGVSIVEDVHLEHFDNFKNIYLENMRRLNAAPMYFFSDEFFIELKKLLKLSGRLIHAKSGNEILGSTAFLAMESYAHYFLSSATEEGRKMGVSNLMLNNGILDANKKGYVRMHLGGGVTGMENDPLLVFKKNFSKTLVKFYIGKRVHNIEKYSEIVAEWDSTHPVEAITHKSVLQRYRLHV